MCPLLCWPWQQLASVSFNPLSPLLQPLIASPATPYRLSFNPFRPSLSLPLLIAGPSAALAACRRADPGSRHAHWRPPLSPLLQPLASLPIDPTDRRAIRRTGRVSLVVLALAAVMLIGGLAVGGFGITIIMDAVKTGNLGTLPLCPA